MVFEGRSRDGSYQSPRGVRDRYRNLADLVAIALETGEDPLILAQSAGVSPSALVRALPAAFLARFIPAGVEFMTPQEILLKLASNHALDVAVLGMLDESVDAKTRVVLSRDLMDRTSLVGAKKTTPARNIQLSDQALAKLLELEKLFTTAGYDPETIPQDFAAFHRVAGGVSEEERKDNTQEGWPGPVLPAVRNLEFDLE